MNNANLQPEAPKILKEIKWLILYGRDHWKIVLIAVAFILCIFLFNEIDWKRMFSSKTVIQKDTIEDILRRP